MRGDVKLNNVWYKTQGLPVQSLANQMASKVGQGTSEYGDLTSWSAWVQEDWGEGVGRLQPHKRGGMLYSEVESRVPSQLILSGLPVQVDQRDLDAGLSDNRYMPSAPSGTFTVSSVLPTTKAAVTFTLNYAAGASWPANRENILWVYCRAAAGTVLNFEVRNNTASSPGSTVYTSGTVTVTADTKGFYWHGVKVSGHGSLLTGTQYWLTIFPTSGTIEVGYGAANYATASQLLVNGTWTAQASKYMMFSTGTQKIASDMGAAQSDASFVLARLGTSLFLTGGGTEIYKYDTTNDEWDGLAPTATFDEVRFAVEWNGLLYLATNSGTNAHSLTALGVAANLTYAATTFARNGGYLWRSVLNVPYYSEDGTTWVTFDEMKVGVEEYPILCMCGVGNDMFAATAEGLYRITDGDFAVSVTPWSSTDARNGISMVNFQGTLYIAANGRVMRYTEDGTLQDIWIMRDDDLVAGRLGRVWALCVVNNCVMALANSEAVGSAPTVWAFQNESWHHIATLPYVAPPATTVGQNLYNMLHDTETNYLWIVTPIGVTYRIYVSETAINPYNDSSTLYTPYGWVEWDWFDSPILDADKDYDGVRIFGENFDATCSAIVYWKDDASTAWEELGTIDSNNEELRWTLEGNTRPDTKRFKLALLLKTTDATQTPRVRAVRVKYHLMVKDWWRWSFNAQCSGRTGGLQELPDGTRHTLTGAQMKDNIEALALLRPPFVYRDIDGIEYEVKVQDANFTYGKSEYNEATADSWWEGVWRMTIEQVTEGAYSYSFADSFDRGAGAIGNGWDGDSWLIADGKAVNAPTLGSELIVNGAFAADTNWTKENGWTIAAGVATKGTSDASNRKIYQNVLTTDKWYRCVYTVASLLDGAARPYFNASYTAGGTLVDGTFTTTLYATGAAAGILGTATTTTMNLDNVSFKGVPYSSMFATRDCGNDEASVSAALVVLQGNRAGIVLCLDDPDDPANFVIATHDGSSVIINKCVNGVMSQVTATSNTYVVGATIMLAKSGTTFTMTYNGVAVLAGTVSDASIVDNTYHGLFSPHPSNTFDNLVITIED